MKNKITVSPKNDQLNFFFHYGSKKIFLFSQRFSKAVFHFFLHGKTESEILSYKRWNQNPRLDKTIEKIPMYLRYIRKEVIA